MNAEARVPGKRSCAKNTDCAATEFCQLDGHCIVTGAAAGQCAPRPLDCPDHAFCPTVCGCDGKNYCDACEAHAAGVSVAAAGGCLAATCAGLETLYQAELKVAKQCCAACASVQCTIKVPAKLACGCDTYINVQTQKLVQIRDEWLARGCQFQIACPMIACQPLQGSSCAVFNAPPGPGAAGCVDFLPD